MFHDPLINSQQNLVFEPSRRRSYAGLETGLWWKEAHKLAECDKLGGYLMPIILYTDGASPDFRRNLSIKPIVVSVGNFNVDCRRMVAGKRCVGYWPKLKVLCIFMHHTLCII